MSAEVLKAAAILRSGGLVAFPTETVYGLGADAFNPLAVARIFEAKRRPLFDPLIVHVTGLQQAAALVASLPETARRLAEEFWPGPLSLVLPKAPSVPDIVTSGLPSVAVRAPDHPLAGALIRAADRPLAAPSANLFGGVSPTTAAHVRSELGDRVDFVLDGGPCRVGVESTIVSLLSEPPVLLRAGGVALEELRAVVGEVAVDCSAADVPLAPGQLPRHYATRTPLYLESPPAAGRAAYLGLQAPEHPERYARIEILAEDGDLRKAAANLFAAMRRLDEAGVDFIVAALVPDRGLGRAINDRLRRAGRAPDAFGAGRR